MHIDFGFILGISPGGNLGFEASPFKLSKEMLDLLGLCIILVHPHYLEKISHFGICFAYYRGGEVRSIPTLHVLDYSGLFGNT